jgi:hypothetical protein
MAKRTNHVVTGKVRLSYANLFTPRAHAMGGEPKYSTTILVPKSDTATKQCIDAAIAAATEDGVQRRWGGVKPPLVPIPVYDGDGTRPSDGMPFGDECKGHWVFTASSKQAPEVVDQNLNPIIDQSQVYSGMYARVSCTFFPYAVHGKKGIGCGLGNVQKLADGVPLGGRTTAEEDFGALPQPQQVQQQPAQQQPVYQQPYQQPQQPNYGQPAPVQIDPITGKPV